MSWLFLIGLAFDGIGAFMISLPILSPGTATREAARPRFGGDHWAPFVRDREARLVQYGALFLVGGFALQAAGYIARICPRWLALLLVAILVAVGLRAGTWLANRGLPKHVWYPELQPSDTIADGFITYGVQNTADLERIVGRALRETRNKEIEPIPQASQAHISGGIWTVYCPRCGQPTAATTPSWRKAICTTCGALYDVEYPDDDARAQIEAELVQRPDPAERRWVRGENAS
jgi:hypothetical protein